MEIAVFGTAVACRVVSYLKAADHDSTAFEQYDHVGGHPSTVRTIRELTRAPELGFLGAQSADGRLAPST